MLNIGKMNHFKPTPLPRQPGAVTTHGAVKAPAATEYTPAARGELSPTYGQLRQYGHLLKQAAAVDPAVDDINQSLLGALQGRQLAAPFSASPLLTQLGALASKTPEYYQETRLVTPPKGAPLDAMQPEFGVYVGPLQQSLKLAVRTQEGDAVVIDLVHRGDIGGEGVGVRLNVTGTLSLAEQQAVNTLTQKIGALADNFFRGDGTALRGLDDLDMQQLQSFKLNLGRNSAAGFVSSDYEFSLDALSGRRRLTGADENGYRFAVDMQAQKSGQTAAENAALQSYVDTLNKSTDAADTPVSSKQFLQDAFTSLLGAAAPQDGKFTPVSNANTAIVNAFDSGLPDFNARFSLHKSSGPGLKSLPKMMDIVLQQTTKIESTEQGTIYHQVAHYEFDSRQIEALNGAPKPDLLGGNFKYTAIHQESQTTRNLNLTRNYVDDASEEKTSAEKKTEKSYRNFSLQDTKEKSSRDYQFRSLAQSFDMAALNAEQNLMLATLKAFKTAPLFL